MILRKHQIKIFIFFIFLYQLFFLHPVPLHAQEMTDDCENWNDERAGHYVGLLSPRLFWKTEKSPININNDDREVYGIRFSMSSVLEHTLELKRIALQCGRESQQLRIQDFLHHLKTGMRVSPLQKKLEVLQEAALRIEKIRSQFQHLFASRAINLTQYLNSKKYIFQILQEKNRVASEVASLQNQRHYSSKILLPPPQNLHSELQKKEDLMERKIHLIREIDFDLEWGKKKNPATGKIPEDYIGINIVFPLKTLASVFMVGGQANQHQNRVMKNLQHPESQLQQGLVEFSENLRTQRENLKELKSIFTKEILQYFEMGKTNTPKISQEIWLENMLLYADYVYLNSYVKDLEGFSQYVPH